jgi:hypothetical protein
MSDVKGQAAPRKTLKLSAAPARIAPPPKAAQKTSAAVDWAAEHKRRMQADMDALIGSRRK